MPLVNVLSVEVRPDRIRRHDELCHDLAEHAKNSHEKMHWTIHQTRIGSPIATHIVRSANTFEELAAPGMPEDMFARVLGTKRAREWFDEVQACVTRRSEAISVDRPELSYPPERDVRTAPFAIVTRARARQGEHEACEELIRKVAEAIPKVGDASRMTCFQTIFGDLSLYWTLRPLQTLADLDKQARTSELLMQAFGPAEGGLIYRTGLEAMAEVHREIVAYRPELSHPSGRR